MSKVVLGALCGWWCWYAMWYCRLRHRGPDWSGLFVDEEAGCYLSHERLAIIDPTSGDQPLYNGSKNIVVAVRTTYFFPPPLIVHNDSGSRLVLYRSSSDGSTIVTLDSDDDDVGFCGFWVFWGFLFWNCHYCNRLMERFTTTRLWRNQWRSTTTIPTAIVKLLPIW